MGEVPRYYSDAFEVVGNPWGLTIKFSRRTPTAGPPSPPEELVHIDMSWEHAKTMTYILWRYIRETEHSMGVSHELPLRVLSDLRIGKEDWDNFWRPSA